MSIGYVHLFALPAVKADSGEIVTPMYQFSFNAGGNAFSKVFDEPELVEFLSEELALRADLVDDAMGLLRTGEKATIPNVELSENDAAAMGLQEVGSDY